MDVGHAAGAANAAAAAAAHVPPAQAPVEQFVTQVEGSTESSTDASREHAQHVLSRGQGHKHGVIKNLSDDDLAALVGLTGVMDASAQINADVDEAQPADPDLVADVAARAENASAFGERVTQNLLAEAARREAAAEPPPAPEAPSGDGGVEVQTVDQVVAESTTVVDLSAKNFPDPTLKTLLAEMAQIEAPDATQAAQLA